MLKHAAGHMDGSDTGTLTYYFRPCLRIRQNLHADSTDLAKIDAISKTISIDDYEVVGAPAVAEETVNRIRHVGEVHEAPKEALELAKTVNPDRLVVGPLFSETHETSDRGFLQCNSRDALGIRGAEIDTRCPVVHAMLPSPPEPHDTAYQAQSASSYTIESDSVMTLWSLELRSDVSQPQGMHSYRFLRVTSLVPFRS